MRGQKTRKLKMSFEELEKLNPLPALTQFSPNPHPNPLPQGEGTGPKAKKSNENGYQNGEKVQAV
jgi:hypothetical protein